jgi:hypothetical protein
MIFIGANILVWIMRGPEKGREMSNVEFINVE